MNAKSIALFDLSVTADSPAGSCILQMLKGLCQEYQFTVFADRFDNPNPQAIRWVRVPLPHKPVFLRYMVFKWLAPLVYWLQVRHRGEPDLIIGTFLSPGLFNSASGNRQPASQISTPADPPLQRQP
jgi:hypothetical protein